MSHSASRFIDHEHEVRVIAIHLIGRTHDEFGMQRICSSVTSTDLIKMLRGSTNELQGHAIANNSNTEKSIPATAEVSSKVKQKKTALANEQMMQTACCSRRSRWPQPKTTRRDSTDKQMQTA